MMTMTEPVRSTATLSTPKGWLIAPAIGVVAITGVMGSGAGFSVSDDLPVEAMVDQLERCRTPRLGATLGSTAPTRFTSSRNSSRLNLDLPSLNWSPRPHEQLGCSVH